MRITLTPDQERIVRLQLKTGAYRDASAVIDHALNGLIEDAIIDSLDQEELKAKLKEARESLDRGEGIVLRGRGELRAYADSIVERGRTRLAERKNAK